LIVETGNVDAAAIQRVVAAPGKIAVSSWIIAGLPIWGPPMKR